MSMFIGLISGTSMDGVDAALVEINESNLSVVSSLTHPYPDSLRDQLIDVIHPGYKFTLHDYASLDINIGHAFATAANELLSNNNLRAQSVEAIGSHGQTLRHSPDSNPPYSLQIGNAPAIAAGTGISTVSDFRGLDIATGGQGAPLVPAFHLRLLGRNDDKRMVLNLGGIANLTLLPIDASSNVLGFDTGPANCLMDEWCLNHLNTPFDSSGKWAAQGDPSETLLRALLKDKYFKKPIPKSTGREYFNSSWLTNIQRENGLADLSPVDIQATLLRLTIDSIVEQIDIHASAYNTLIVCGGGVFNETLMGGLRKALPHVTVTSIDKYGIDPSVVEASAFAWLAYCRCNKIEVQLTTRSYPVKKLIGALHYAPS